MMRPRLYLLFDDESGRFEFYAITAAPAVETHPPSIRRGRVFSLFDDEEARFEFWPATTEVLPTLAVQDGAHAHLAENVVLDTGETTLTVADSVHGHAADAAALFQAHTLEVSDGQHGHAADGISFAGAAVTEPLPGVPLEQLYYRPDTRLRVRDSRMRMRSDRVHLDAATGDYTDDEIVMMLMSAAWEEEEEEALF